MILTVERVKEIQAHIAGFNGNWPITTGTICEDIDISELRALCRDWLASREAPMSGHYPGSCPACPDARSTVQEEPRG